MKTKAKIFAALKMSCTMLFVVIFLASNLSFTALYSVDFDGQSSIYQKSVKINDGTSIVIHQGEQISIPCSSTDKIVIQTWAEPGMGWSKPFEESPSSRYVVELRSFDGLKKEDALAFALAGIKRRKIILNTPPVFSPWHLPAGISYLTSLLRSKGHEVSERYGHIIGLEHVLLSRDKEQSNIALNIMRSKNNTAVDWYMARKIFEDVSGKVVTMDKFAVQRNNVNYVAAGQDGTMQSAINAIDNREADMWYDYFKTVEIPHALSYKPDLYGISIGDERQLFPGLILASMVKDYLPETLVVLGGNFWSRAMTAYFDPMFSTLFDKCCDGIIYREGFNPIIELAESLNPKNSSGTAWNNNGIMVLNKPNINPFLFEHLPAPDYDGGAKQWSSEPVYSLYSTSNCFMACEFCSISSGSDSFLGKPRTTSAHRVVEQMISIGGHRFDFCDEMLTVQNQIKIGEELRKAGYNAQWQSYMTANEQLMNPELCHALYEAGCRSVQLGLESLHIGTLDNENKRWNKPENYGKILSNLRSAGIHTHIFIIIGLPGEPLHQTLRWLPFLEEHGENILTIKAGRYRISRTAPDEQKGIFTDVELLPNDNPLQLNRKFHYRSVSAQKIDALRDLLEQACREHWAYGVTSAIPWWINRGHYTWDELKQMSYEVPKDSEVNHLKKSVAKARTILREEIGKDITSNSFHELIEFAKNI